MTHGTAGTKGFERLRSSTAGKAVSRSRSKHPDYPAQGYKSSSPLHVVSIIRLASDLRERLPDHEVHITPGHSGQGWKTSSSRADAHVHTSLT
jgi:hypothetical protein